MTREEYDDKRQELHDDYRRKMRGLMREYTNSNSVAKKGDIVKDHCQIIRVESASVYAREERPCLIYNGPLLTQKLVPYKNGKIGNVYQCNITEIVSDEEGKQ